MNKKAQVPALFTIIIAIALSASALYIIVTSNNNRYSNLIEINNLIEQTQFKELYIKEQAKIILNETINLCQSCTEKNLKELFKEKSIERQNLFHYDGAGNFYANIKEDNLEIKEEENYKLSIPEIKIESEINQNEIQKNFNLCILFDKQGDFVGYC
ncbi:hypothetical protein HY450_03900 [Candidatus Pacearchaeota archaeon]|nr:hypothetical protein [Candidatus Pacearchaeota archaeon]